MLVKTFSGELDKFSWFDILTLQMASARLRAGGGKKRKTQGNNALSFSFTVKKSASDMYPI